MKLLTRTLMITGILGAVMVFGLANAKTAPTIWKESTGRFKQPLVKGLPSFSPLIKEVKDAVVNISATRTETRRPTRQQQPNPFEDFFGPDFYDFFGPQGPQGRQSPRAPRQGQSLGSGFIISEDGYIVTNHHVIENGTKIRVTLNDGTEYIAEIKGGDSQSDVGLLKIKPKDKLKYVTFGDSSDLEVGDWVVAIGSPFGLHHTVTSGIVSAKSRRNLDLQTVFQDFTQTDASINPGNSGGPLFNLKGEAIGINTAILANGQGIGFAIPINLAKEIIQRLNESGKVERGWIGVQLQPMTRDIAAGFDWNKNYGVLVAKVEKSTPAESAGLKDGDILVAINGERVEDIAFLQRKIGLAKVGSTFDLRVFRNSAYRNFKLTTRGMPVAGTNPQPDDSQQLTEEQSLGMALTERSITAAQSDELELGPKSRNIVQVTQITGEKAQTAGMQRSDIILEVRLGKERAPIRSIKDFSRMAKKFGAQKSSPLVLGIARGTQRLFAIIRP